MFTDSNADGIAAYHDWALGPYAPGMPEGEYFPFPGEPVVAFCTLAEVEVSDIQSWESYVVYPVGVRCFGFV